MLNQKWFRILVFYLIALISSIVLRIDSPEWFNQFHLPYGLSIYKEWLGGLGPFFGALFVTRIFNVERTISFFGTSKAKSILMAIIPVVLFTIVGASTSEVNNHFYGFHLGVMLVIYGLLEETGWRGYLQDELRGIHPVIKYVLIGFLWYAWHLTFIGNILHLKSELSILFILILASWGIGQAAEYTQSIIVSGCLHIIGNIMAFSSLILQGIDLNGRLTIAGISVFAFVLMLVVWEKSYFMSWNRK
ncbi:MAG: CPBP family intramembrane metalloprotease [Candidatus Lokiarchaeota archaeon]|nr:CPBP family intramembrane metalloprotease [Candidatus Lokiarchaeota archaeon]